MHDQDSTVMTGVTVTWTTSANSVATVDAAGLVTGAGNETATITASAGAASGSAVVTVTQTVASVEVSPSVAELTAWGETVQLTVEALVPFPLGVSPPIVIGTFKRRTPQANEPSAPLSCRAALSHVRAKVLVCLPLRYQPRALLAVSPAPDRFYWGAGKSSSQLLIAGTVAAAVVAASTVLTGSRLVDRKGTALEVLTVQNLYGDLALALVGHLHEAEAPGATRHPIRNDPGARDLTVLGEGDVQLVLGSLER